MHLNYCRGDYGLRRCDEAQGFELACCEDTAGGGFNNAHHWKIGDVLALEILSAGEAGGAGGRFVIAPDGFADTPHEILKHLFTVRQAGDGNPRLMIAWAGGVNDKGRRPDAIEPLGAQVIQLHEMHIGAVGRIIKLSPASTVFPSGSVQVFRIAASCIMSGNILRSLGPSKCASPAFGYLIPDFTW
jgi:hypothetical protein